MASQKYSMKERTKGKKELAEQEDTLTLQQIDAHSFTGKVPQPEGQGSKLRNNKRVAGQEMSRKYKLPILK